MAYQVRISQRSMFDHFVTNMNMSLAELMDSNIQAGSEKKINKPSDDPIGTARVLGYREQLASLEQYQKNADRARGWLATQDSTLVQVNTVLTRCKELAEQAASGTYSGTNRQQIAFEVRQLFNQLITLANTEYEGKHIYAGHKTTAPAFTQAMGVTINIDNLNANPPGQYTVQGNAQRSIVVQFLEDGTLVSNVSRDFRYSMDGGDTWTTSSTVTTSNANILNMGGVRVSMENGGDVRQVDTTDFSNSIDNGTWLWVRPTAEYLGDDEDVIEVDQYGASPVTGVASGYFNEDVLVRVDNTSSVTLNQTIEYSYSLDRGITWTTGNIAASDASASNALLVVPGGYLELVSNSGNTLAPGDQFIIRPRRADIEFEISANDKITVNAVGKDVFGGIYMGPRSHLGYFNNLSPTMQTGSASGLGQNMFETVGNLVGFLETNNQSGIQDALENLREASTVILTKAADVGGKENRLDVAENVLSSMMLTSKERLSDVEDVDVAELMTKLAQQQLIYESVLKSSSTIMRMSLVNYI